MSAISGMPKPRPHHSRPLHDMPGEIERPDSRPSQSVVFNSVIFAALLFSSTHAGFAQQAMAAIHGVITDPSGDAVDGATLTLTAADTGSIRNTVTNASGVYAFVDVPPATYTLTIAKDGFTSVSRPVLDLAVNQTATYDSQLAIGSKTERITVVANRDIESSTAELGTVIAEQQINELPLNGRNFTGLLALAPGSSPISVAQNATGGSAFAGNAIGSFYFPAVNGQRNRSNMFLLDGSNDLGSFLGNYNFAPIIDTIQEFKLQSHNDEAEFGQVLGGIVNVVTRSGTNQYHGSVWEFLRNEELDARSFFAASRTPLRQNQFGFAAGGPLAIPNVHAGKHKTFFFGGYEGFRQSQASATPLLVPTEAQLGGKFSGQSTPISNPWTTAPDPNNPGSYLRMPFAGNVIPPSLISKAALAWASLFPEPTGSTVPGYNLTDVTPERTDQDSYQIRIDRSVSDRDTLFGRVSYYSQDSSSSGGFPGASTVARINGWNALATEIHTFGPSAVLEVHVARNQGDDLYGTTFPNAPSQIGPSLLASGFASNWISNYQGGNGPYIPTMAISGYASAGDYFQDTGLADTWQLSGNFTKVVGRHTFKAGVDTATNNSRSSSYNATESFTSFETANLESANASGNALASFLLGVPDSARRVNALVTTRGGWVDGGYVQDQWRMTKRLTLNIGVRWDVTLWPINGSQGKPSSYIGDVDLSNGSYLLSAMPPPCSATIGVPCIPGGTLPQHVVVTDQSNGAILHDSYNNWQGRFGFGYRLTERLALRGGYGRFYDNWNSVIQLTQNYGTTWPNVGQLSANNLNFPSPTVGIGDPLGLGSGALQPAATPFNQVAFFVDPEFKLPYDDHWNVGLEQSLAASFLVSAAYVGDYSRHLDVGGLDNVAMAAGPRRCHDCGITTAVPVHYAHLLRPKRRSQHV